MGDIATLLEAIAALVAALFWPALAFTVLFLFKKEIRELLGRIRRGVLMGQEIELDELDQSAAAAELEVAALPRSEEFDEQAPHTPEDEDAIRRVLNEAGRSPKAALLLLRSEMEREANELLGAYGLLRGRSYVPLREAIQMLQQQGALPGHVPSSLNMFLDVVNRLVHGGEAKDDDVLRAIDSGITILRAIRAIPHETNLVYHPGVDLYADPQGRHVQVGSKGVILETESPGGATTSRRIYPTTRDHFQKGKRVAWEWNLDHIYGEMWYQDPDTQQMEKAWDSSMEFVGRHLEDLRELPGQ